MPVKKSASAKQPVRRSAGRPPKARPAGRPLTKSVRSSRTASTIKQPVRRQPVQKTSRQPRPMAQPQVVVVTNQPLVSEEEFAAWQAVRQDEPVEIVEDMEIDSQAADITNQADLAYQPQEMPQRRWSASNDYLSDESGNQRSSRMYRRLALFFIGLVAIVVMAMFYYSLVRVKIILYPTSNQQTQTKTIILTDSVPASEAAVPAKFLQASTEYRQTFKATGQGQASSTGKLFGQVLLSNTTAKDQPLVATTRLLTANGILYRLRSFVVVPAGGQVSAEAYADQVKPENSIPSSTKLTIPGLWEGLRDKIYATAAQPIDYQSNGQSVVLASDLEQAVIQAKQAAADQLKDKLSQQVGSSTAVYWLDDSAWTTSSDAQVGAQKAEFTITVKASAGAAIVSVEAIDEALAGGDDSTLKIDQSSLVYDLSAWQPDQHQAQLKVNYSSSLSADQAEQLINKQALVGLNRQQLDEYLASQPNLVSYKVVWQPGFLNKVPGVDKIQLQLGQ